MDYIVLPPTIVETQKSIHIIIFVGQISLDDPMGLTYRMKILSKPNEIIRSFQPKR